MGRFTFFSLTSLIQQEFLMNHQEFIGIIRQDFSSKFYLELLLAKENPSTSMLLLYSIFINKNVLKDLIFLFLLHN